MQASASAKARALEVVEAEVEERYAALGPLPPRASAAHRASVDAALMRRVYAANLPAAEVARCRDVLHKLAAIDAARGAAEAVRGSVAPRGGWVMRPEQARQHGQAPLRQHEHAPLQ